MDKTDDAAKVNRREVLLGLGSAAAGFTLFGCEAREETTGLSDDSAINQPGNDAVELLSRLDVVTRDTIAGLISFVVPGNDPYSIWQGVSLPESGGMAARGNEYLTLYLNKYIPVPPIAQVALNAMMPQLEKIRLSLPSTLLSSLSPRLRPALSNYGSIYAATLEANNLSLPLAPFLAAVVNFLAITVRPSSVVGPFLTPFPRLSWRDKARVWERFEIFVPDMFTPGTSVSILPPGQYPDVIRTLPGLLDYASGAMLELAAFGSYSEWHVFDYATRKTVARPLGYRLANYGGPVEGWDEFKGYYQGRRSVVDA